MFVLLETRDRLVIAHRPWIAAAVVILMAVVMGYGALSGQSVESGGTRLLMAALSGLALYVWWAYLPFARTVFDRPRRTMAQQEWRITGTRIRVLHFKDIDSVRVQADLTDESRLNRLVVVLTDGDIMPLEYAPGPQDRHPMEKVINDWLARG